MMSTSHQTALRRPDEPDRPSCRRLREQAPVASVVGVAGTGSSSGSRDIIVNPDVAVDSILAPHPRGSLDDAAAERFAEIRHHRESLAQPIGPCVFPIAAMARLPGATGVTNTMTEFSRVPGWLPEDRQIP